MSESARTMLDHARDALRARMSKDDLRLVLENTVTYAAELERQRNAFRDQRNSVFATNERLLTEVQESDQARLLAENETRTVRRESEALGARGAELEKGPVLPWAHAMSDADLAGFLDSLVSAALDRWRTGPSGEALPNRDTLAAIEKTCALWRTPGQGYRSDEDESGGAS